MAGDVALVEEVLKRLDRSSPDKLLRSIAAEIARVHETVAQCERRIAALESGASAPESPPQTWVVDAEQDFDARGFYHLERNGDGLPMRWTGPDADFQFDFPIGRESPRPFTLHFLKFYAPTEPPSLRGEVDGGEIAVAVERLPVGGFVARGVLPARRDPLSPEGRAATVLRFTCPKTGSPRDQGYDDDRVLGLLFRRLDVGAAAVAETAAASA